MVENSAGKTVSICGGLPANRNMTYLGKLQEKAIPKNQIYDRATTITKTWNQTYFENIKLKQSGTLAA